jgi:hypothetical protein
MLIPKILMAFYFYFFFFPFPVPSTEASRFVRSALVVVRLGSDAFLALMGFFV